MIRVAIIEDQREIREGLGMLIGGTPEFQVTHSFGSGEDALAGIGAEPPDVVLVDIGLPGISGLDVIRQLGERNPELKFLVLTSYDDDERIFSALCAGACGYLLKRTPPARLLESIKEVAAGGAPMTPEVARRVLSVFRGTAPPQKSEYRLTPQESKLLKLLVEGHSYKTAAYELGLTVHAIGFHVRNIYEKLPVHSKSEAVATAIHHRLA